LRGFPVSFIKCFGEKSLTTDFLRHLFRFPERLERLEQLEHTATCIRGKDRDLVLKCLLLSVSTNKYHKKIVARGYGSYRNTASKQAAAAERLFLTHKK